MTAININITGDDIAAIKIILEPITWSVLIIIK
jgi:hypothetical protein